jgi:hypothetical protein
MLEAVGWTATAIFAGSYFARRRGVVHMAQIVSALLWVVYGALLSGIAVVAANGAVWWPP